VHVDVDDADAAERIKAFSPQPTVTVFSGGGFNCLWNKAIAAALKADECWNIDRISATGETKTRTVQNRRTAA